MASQIKGPCYTSLPITKAVVPLRRISSSTFTVAFSSGRTKYFFTIKTYPIQLAHHQPQKQLLKSLPAGFQSTERSLMRSISTLQVESSENVGDQRTKSLKATTPVKYGTPAFNKKHKEIQASVVFNKPKTTREGNSFRLLISAPLKNKLNQYQILKYPLVTESAMKNVIEYNTLVFMVDVRSNKVNIKDAFEMMFNIQTKKVNALNNFRGTKKAFIKLRPEYNALDVAKKIKII